MDSFESFTAALRDFPCAFEGSVTTDTIGARAVSAWAATLLVSAETDEVLRTTRASAAAKGYSFEEGRVYDGGGRVAPAAVVARVLSDAVEALGLGAPRDLLLDDRPVAELLEAAPPEPNPVQYHWAEHVLRNLLEEALRP
jgi:hypothetical protein